MSEESKVVVTLDDEDWKFLQTFNLAIARKKSAEEALIKAEEEAVAVKKKFWTHICQKYSLDPEAPLRVDRQKGLIKNEPDPLLGLLKLLGLAKSSVKEKE